jgi:putative transposase
MVSIRNNERFHVLHRFSYPALHDLLSPIICLSLTQEHPIQTTYWLRDELGGWNNAAVVEANGEKDHIHILLSAPPDFNLCRMINSLKTVTSRRLKKEFPDIRKKLWKEKFWTSSYFVATSGGVPLEVIKKYIEEQSV